MQHIRANTSIPCERRANESKPSHYGKASTSYMSPRQTTGGRGECFAKRKSCLGRVSVMGMNVRVACRRFTSSSREKVERLRIPLIFNARQPFCHTQTLPAPQPHLHRGNVFVLYERHNPRRKYNVRILLDTLAYVEGNASSNSRRGTNKSLAVSEHRTEP